MKRIPVLLAVLAVSSISAPSLAADVGVSVTIGEPGFYGRIEIGDFPKPLVVYREPKIVQKVTVVKEPVYLRVPPGHAKHWSKHCARYNACGERVYFVKDEWYEREYVPRYKERHGGHQDNDKHDKHDKDHKKGKHGHKDKDRD